ncbi:MAG: hypothetical protein AUI14_11280 [Actinobacteria bacterium 13_2_20CM_2_71_6]|nr:MAG: hypothetical protein AUI14_11280 [Actinobacteria bacterium 13_2_20CM_2_71_6]
MTVESTSWLFRPVPPWSRGKPFLWALFVFGLLAEGIGLVLPFVLALEPATSMPYSWPAHHAIYLHTTYVSSECTIQSPGYEPVIVSIPAADPMPFSGRRLPAREYGPATVTCSRPTTVDVDPGPWYSLASQQTVKYPLTMLGGVALFWVYRMTLGDPTRKMRRSPATSGG